MLTITRKIFVNFDKKRNIKDTVFRHISFFEVKIFYVIAYKSNKMLKIQKPYQSIQRITYS